MADNVSLKIWNAIEPLVNRKIEEQTRNCQRMKSMAVSTAYNAQTGVVGVTEAFGKEIFLPVISTIDVGKLTVGANVWVSMPYSSMSNAIVVMMGDGDNGNMAATAEMTAGELSAKTADEKTAFYNSGIRLLKVVNGDTVVLLGLDSDGSTEWLGSNQPANNLLDNSDFTDPVNQRGGTSGAVTAWTYFIDRWQATDAALTYSIGADGLHLTAGEAWMAQNVQSSETKAGTTYTLVVGFNDGTFTLCTGALPAGETSWTEFAGENDDNCYVRMAKITGAAISCSFKPKKAVVATWAALYEGAYTADTLPPYVPKGYAAELAECMRYYRKIKIGSIGKGNYIGLAIPLSPQMRINPTATLSGVINTNNGTAQITVGALAAYTDYIRLDAYTDISDFNWWFAEYILSADL